jgi:2-methylaconitate cis-trans-isomerase PrpF
MHVLAELRDKKIKSTAILRTARKLFDGKVFPIEESEKG